MAKNPEHWSDLTARMFSGAAMVVVGLLGIWFGGHVFHVLVAIICGLMVWELVGMLRPGARHVQLQLGETRKYLKKGKTLKKVCVWN